MDCSPPGSSAHGILQARILERVATVLPRGGGSSRPWARTCISCLAGGFFTSEPLGNKYLWFTREPATRTRKGDRHSAPEGAKKQSAEQSGDEPRKAWEGTPQRGTGPPGGGDGEELGNTVSHGGGLGSSQGAVSWGV